jgi:hypothetical protein
MQACEGGRICQDCSKVIVDFREKNAHEIAKIHAFSSEPVCGIYSKDKLYGSSELRFRSRKFKKWALGLFTLASLSQHPEIVNANEPRVIQLIGTEANHSLSQTNPSNSKQDSVIISGMVYSDENGILEPIPFASVFVSGTEKGTNTDFDGKFSLAFSSEMFVEDSIVLVVQYIGYSKLEMLVKKESQKLKLVLKNDTEMVAFGVEVLPFHTRIWRKLTSPFTKKY